MSLTIQAWSFWGRFNGFSNACCFKIHVLPKDVLLNQLDHLGLPKKVAVGIHGFLAPLHILVALPGPTSDMDVAKRRGLTAFKNQCLSTILFELFSLYPMFFTALRLFNLFMILSTSFPLDLQISVSLASVSRKLAIHLSESLDSTRMRFLLGDSEDCGHTN